MAKHGATVAHAHCAGNSDDDSIDPWSPVGNSSYTTSFVDVSHCLG
jgi:hypothetical protein